MVAFTGVAGCIGAFCQGWLPLPIGARVAEPGKVCIAGTFGTAEFTRQDSVLIVHDPLDSLRQGTPLELIRADGRRHWIRAGPDSDPMWQDLLSRWCYLPLPPNAPNAEATP